MNIQEYNSRFQDLGRSIYLSIVSVNKAVIMFSIKIYDVFEMHCFKPTFWLSFWTPNCKFLLILQILHLRYKILNLIL